MARRKVRLRGWLLAALVLPVVGFTPHGSDGAEDFGVGPVRLVSSKAVYGPGEQIRIDAYLSRPVDLRSYRVALDASGGELGALVPVDASLDRTRSDFVFTGRSSAPVADPNRPSVAADLPRGSVSGRARAYLGSFTLLPSIGARGEFGIRLCSTDSTLVDSSGDAIELPASEIFVTVAGPTPEPDLPRRPRVPLVTVTTVPWGSTWNYLDDGSDQGTAWTAVAFDDGDWAAGPAELGYGDGDEATVVGCGCSVPTCTNTTCLPKHITTYFRHTFSIENAASVADLVLNVIRDDGVVVYLNGTEVCRDKMPDGTILFDTPASSPPASGSDEWTPVACTGPALQPGLLVDGDNTLSAEVHQASADSSDISFNLELIAEILVGAPFAPTLISPLDGATDVSLNPELRVNAADPDLDDLTVTFYGRGEGEVPPGEDFTIIHVGDMQYYAQSYPDTYIAIMQWIRDQKGPRNIVFADQSGDLVNTADQIGQWDNAHAALSILEPPILPDLLDGLPYGVTPGNHDSTPNGNPDGTENYNLYFGLERFCPGGACRSYYGGNYGTDNDNNYQLFSAGGMDFIVAHMEYDTSPDAGVLAWADDLLQTHTDRRAIVTSHYIMEPGEQSPFGDQGLAIYNQLMDRPNLFLMLAGHKHGEGKRFDDGGASDVWTMIANYQDYPNGGNGLIRILEFSPANNEIRVSTYSPWISQESCTDGNQTWVPGEGCFETDADSQFVLSYEMTVGLPFVELGTVNVASGSDALVTWPDLTAAVVYEWYVTVSDGSTTTTGPRWSFHTRCGADGDCDDGNFCTVDTCDNGTCEHANNHDAACDDGDPCTTADQCISGGCSGSPVSCPFGMSCDPGTVECAVTPMEATFQDGLDGYAGTRDSFVREAGPAEVHGADLVFEWDDDDPNGDPVERNFGLLRFENILGSGAGQVPPGAQITSAVVTYALINDGTSGDFHEALRDWDESDSLDSFCGAGCDEGVEFDAGIVDSAAGSPTGVHTVDVTASIESWADNVEGNRGWVILPSPSGAGGVELRSSEFGTVSGRPKLTVIYTRIEPCTLDSECDDGDSCTVDTCDRDFDACKHVAPPIPTEVRDLRMSRSSGSTTAVIAWSADPAATSYNVYRGARADLGDLTCFQSGVLGESTEDDGALPEIGELLFHLTTAVNCSGESPLGADPSNPASCP